MEQVFRIEIPVEAVDKTDKAALQQLESTLQKIFSALKENKSASADVFSAIEQGASEARSSLDQAAEAAKRTASSYEDISDSASEAGNEQEQAASEAESANENLGNTVNEVADAYDDVGQAAQQAGQKSGSAFTTAANNADKFTQRMEKSSQTLRSMFKEKLKLTLAAIDRASPVIKEVWNNAKSLAGKTWNVALHLKDFVTAPFRKIIDLINSPITMALSIAGVGVSASDVIQTFNDFESGMSAVRSLTGATDEDFLRLKDTAKDLGATTVFSASQASEGMQYLAMAGWDTNQIIAAMPGLLDLAAAGATELGTASDIVSDVMTAMGMEAGEASRAADVFAKTATSSNTTIEGLGETLKYAAPIAHIFGLELEQVAALAGMMGDAGIKGSQAGTAMRSALLRLASPEKDAATWMKKLNLSFTESGGKMKDMSKIIRETGAAFAGLTQSDKLVAAKAIFGTEAASAWLAVLDRGADKFDEFTASLEQSNGAAKQMAETRLDNLAGDITLLQSAAEGMKISLMERLDPYMRKGVQWVTNAIPGLTDTIGNSIDKAANKAQKLTSFLTGVFDSFDFKHADGFVEKAFVAWDKIIAEPFDDWWSGNGRSLILGKLGDLGEGAGELLHGIVKGAFAAIKGEEVDLDGLNTSGFEKAGSEADQTFISSFMSGLDISDLFGDTPTFLKAGLLGFGAFKVGGTAIGAAKTYGALKTALAGTGAAATKAVPAIASVGSAAASSAAGIAKTSTILGGLKVALSSIPVWGWVAVAALTATAVGIKAYNDAQEQQRQELLHVSDAGEKAAEKYKESAEQYLEYSRALSSYNNYQLDLETKFKPVDEATIKNAISKIGTQQIELEAILADGGLSEAERMKLSAQILTIEAQKVALQCTLVPPTEEDKSAVKQQITMLEEQEISIKAAIASGGLSDEDVASLKQQISDIEISKICLKAAIEPLTAEEIKVLTDELDKIEKDKISIQAEIEKGGLPQEQVDALNEQIDKLNQREVLIKATLGNLSDEEIAQYASQQLGIDYSELVKMSGGVFTEADVKAGRITPEFYDSYLEQMRTQADTDLLNFQTEVTSARDSIPEAVQKRDEYSTSYEAAAAQAESLLEDKLFLSELDTQGKNLIAKYNAGQIDMDSLMEAGDKMLKSISNRFGEYGLINAGSMTPDMLFGEMTGGLFGTGVFGHYEVKDTDPFSSAMNELTGKQTYADQRAAESQSDYDTQNTALVGQYQNEKSLIEAQTFHGSELAGMSLEEVAKSYATLDEAGKKMFDDAVMALNTLNAQTDYIDDGEKTQAVDVVDLAAKAEIMETVKSQVQDIATQYQAMSADQQATFSASEEGAAQLAAVNEALSNLGLDKIDSLDQLSTALDSIASADLSSFTLENVQEAFKSLGGDATGCKTQVDNLRNALDQINGKQTYSQHTHTNLTIEKTVYQNHGRYSKYAENAEGGIYDGAFLSWVAEDGPEAIIPLGANRRERGLDLWMQAGKALGVGEYADGGILAPYTGSIEAVLDGESSSNENREVSPIHTSPNTGGKSINVNVSANPVFQIDGGSGNDIMQQLKAHQKELAEILGGAIADQLGDIIENMV